MNQFDDQSRPKNSGDTLKKQTVKIRVKFLSPAEIARRVAEDRAVYEAELKASQPKVPMFNRQEFDFLLTCFSVLAATFFTGCVGEIVRKSVQLHGNGSYANIVHKAMLGTVFLFDVLAVGVMFVTFHTARQANARRNRLARFAR